MEPPRTLPFTLTICGRHEVDRHAGRGVTHVLSIDDPGTPPLAIPWFRGVRRRFQFHDVETDDDARRYGKTPPGPDDVAAILAFGREVADAARSGRVHLLVHCYAGACRSTAAAYAILAEALGPGRAAEALAAVVAVREEAFPNARLVRLADRILGRAGELDRALAPLRDEFRRLVDDYAAQLRGRPPSNPGGSQPTSG